MLPTQLLLLLFLACVSLAWSPTWYIHVFARYHPHPNSKRKGLITSNSVLEVPERDAQRVLKRIGEWSDGEYAAKRIAKHNALVVTTDEIFEDRGASRKKNAEIVQFIEDKLAI